MESVAAAVAVGCLSRSYHPHRAFQSEQEMKNVNRPSSREALGQVRSVSVLQEVQWQTAVRA